MPERLHLHAELIGQLLIAHAAFEHGGTDLPAPVVPGVIRLRHRLRRLPWLSWFLR
jgi:hypothetical protein